MAKPALASVLLAAAALGLVARVRRKTLKEMPKPAPLIPLDLPRANPFRISVIAAVCGCPGMTVALLALPFYLQHSLGQGTLTTGLCLAPGPLTAGSTQHAVWPGVRPPSGAEQSQHVSLGTARKKWRCRGHARHRQVGGPNRRRRRARSHAAGALEADGASHTAACMQGWPQRHAAQARRLERYRHARTVGDHGPRPRGWHMAAGVRHRRAGPGRGRGRG